MTKRSLLFIGGCALASFGAGAFATLRRRSEDVRTQALREKAHCERLLRGLDARCAGLR